MGDVAWRGAVVAVAAPAVGAVGDAAGRDLRVPAWDRVRAARLVRPPLATLPRRQRAIHCVARGRQHEAHVSVHGLLPRSGSSQHDDERGLLHDDGDAGGDARKNKRANGRLGQTFEQKKASANCYAHVYVHVRVLEY